MMGRKVRALVMAALMVTSVATVSAAFVGSAAAADTQTDVLDLTPEKHEVITGDEMDAIDVTIDNADPAESYEYRLYGPDGDFIESGESSDDMFTVTAKFASEGAYTIEVINDAGTQVGSLCISSHYKMTLSSNSVAVGDEEIIINGTLVDEGSDPVAGEVVEIDDLEAQRENSRDTNAAGEFSFTIIPDEVESYEVYDPETAGCEERGHATDNGVKLQYTTFEVQPNDLTVQVDRTGVLAGHEERVDVMVMRDGEEVNGPELRDLAFDITQNGTNVAADGMFTDEFDDNGPNDGDLWVDAYNVAIDADQSVNESVKVRVYKPLPGADNPRLEGTQTIDVLSPDIEVTPTNFTKGVRTDVTITASDPRTGDPLPEDEVEAKLINDNMGIDEEVVELQSDEMDILQTDGERGAAAGSVELTDGESAVVREDSDDANLRFDVNATIYAFDENDPNESVTLDVLARADDDATEGAPYDLFGGTVPAVFEQLDGTAEPGQIPVAGESVVTVTTTDAAGDPLDRFVDIDGARINDEIEGLSDDAKLESTEGDTGSDGMIAFSPNPDRTGTITLDVGYDDELVDGDVHPPDEITTDTVDVVSSVSDTGANNSSQVGATETVQPAWYTAMMSRLEGALT